jgi:hypothetical protein
MKHAVRIPRAVTAAFLLIVMPLSQNVQG